MATGAAPKEFLPLTSDQKQVVGSLVSATKLVAVALVVLGVVYIVGGPYSAYQGGGVLSAILATVQGVLTVILGLVMLAVSSGFQLLGQVPQYAGNHFRNVAKDLTMFHKMQVGLAVVIALLAIVRHYV